MFAPIRIQNLSTIRLDQHISWNANRLRLSFPAHEVKNDQALDFLLPVEASERIKRYINDWRSLFMPRQIRICFLVAMANQKINLLYAIR